MRIGFGYDVHKFKEGRELILGGEKIDYSLGLDGHSDADVLIHAIMDAMLGSLALSDIGTHFPDTSDEFKGIKSTKLLSLVYQLITDKGYKIGNIDCVIACEKPKLMPYIPKMRENISQILKTDIDNISIKATTEEKMGFTGRMEGVKAYSVCLLEKM